MVITQDARASATVGAGQHGPSSLLLPGKPPFKPGADYRVGLQGKGSIAHGGRVAKLGTRSNNAGVRLRRYAMIFSKQDRQRLLRGSWQERNTFLGKTRAEPRKPGHSKHQRPRPLDRRTALRKKTCEHQGGRAESQKQRGHDRVDAGYFDSKLESSRGSAQLFSTADQALPVLFSAGPSRT